MGKTLEDSIKVSNPGGNAVSHRLDARIYPDRRNYVYLYATAPSEAQLRQYSISHRSSDAYVLKIPVKAIRLETTLFWTGDPYSDGERIDNFHNLADRLHKQPELLDSISVDILNAVRYNYILNAPSNVTSKNIKVSSYCNHICRRSVLFYSSWNRC